MCLKHHFRFFLISQEHYQQDASSRGIGKFHELSFFVDILLSLHEDGDTMALKELYEC